MKQPAHSKPSFRTNRYVTILMAALLLGFAWQIRGSGTSDPSVVALLFLLFLSVSYGPRKKFNLLLFGLIAFMFNVMRTGWGTFVPQSGLPGLIPGYLPPDIKIAVPWWYGYFWLFIVGISWMGIPSLLFGGYFFTKQKYHFKDVVIIVVLFVGSVYLARFAVEPLIPLLAPEYYHKIYLTGISERSYGSMIGNMSTAVAIIPVLLYILFIKKDKVFFRHSLIAMTVFAFSLAVANVCRPLSILTGEGKYHGWSLWEYFTGFLFGGLIFRHYNNISGEELSETDLSFDLKYAGWKPVYRFLLFALAFYRLVLYGIGESLDGAVSKALAGLGIDEAPSGDTLMAVTVVTGTVLYGFYFFGKIGRDFAKKPFTEKSHIALMVLLSLHYLFFATHHIIKGDLLLLRSDNLAVWLDTISFIIIQTYLIFLYRKSVKHKFSS